MFMRLRYMMSANDRGNRTSNEGLYPRYPVSGVRRERNCFDKDKSSEKLAETKEDLLERRTDGTDAFSLIRSKLLRGRYTLHRLRKIPLPRLFLPLDVRSIMT